MSIGCGNAASIPDWGILSEELQDLPTHGPLQYGAIRARYKAAHGRELHGVQLRASLANGNLKGLRFNTTNHTLECEDEPAKMDAPRVLPPTPPSGPPDSALLEHEPAKMDAPRVLPPIPPSGQPDSALFPSELVLARELRALVCTEGPLRTSDVAERYQVMYGKQLTLHGYGLRRRLLDDDLKGLRFDERRGMVDLCNTLSTAEESEALPTPQPTLHPEAPAGAAHAAAPRPAERVTADPAPATAVAEELRALVTTKGPLQMSDVAIRYLAVYGKMLTLHGYNLRRRLKDGNLLGLRYNESSGKLELDGTPPSAARESEALPATQPASHAEVPAGAARAAAAAPPAEIATADPAPATAIEMPAVKIAAVQDAGASAAVSEQRPGATIQRPVSSTSPPIVTGRRVVSGVGGVPSTAPFPTSPPSDTKLRYLLIDSPASCKKALTTLSCTGALGNTLQHACVGSMVVVQLNGLQLGSEAGLISLVKVGSLHTWCLRCFDHSGTAYTLIPRDATESEQDIDRLEVLDKRPSELHGKRASFPGRPVRCRRGELPTLFHVFSSPYSTVPRRHDCATHGLFQIIRSVSIDGGAR